MALQNGNNQGKTLIGILASHDSIKKNNELARLFEELYKQDEERKKQGKDKLLDKFHFVLTGGTFQRLLLDKDTEKRTDEEGNIEAVDKGLRDIIKHNATSLPDRKIGGITILSNLIVQKQCSILWSFFSPITVHWLGPENLALMRLCDIWNVKRLMNPQSVRAWFHDEAERDTDRNRQNIPLEISFGDIKPKRDKNKEQIQKQIKGYYEISLPMGAEREKSEKYWSTFGEQTIALIAHDEMKERIVNFAIQYENELGKFGRILATGATAQAIKNACRKLSKKEIVMPCLPGPHGGDIEIATAVLFNECHTVIFFIDPLHPHPHIEDIRTVFSACMAEIENNSVRMLTNEVQAREWIEETVRRHPK